jgi:hypothetical protein
MGIWVHPSHTVIPVQVGPNFRIFGVRVNPNNIMVSCLEAVNHPTLLLTSIWDVYEVPKLGVRTKKHTQNKKPKFFSNKMEQECS